MKNEERHHRAVDELYKIADDIYNQIDRGQIPRMSIPLRSKKNIQFAPRKGVWKYGSMHGVRSAKKMTGAYMLLRTMYMLEFIQSMVKDQKSSTLREMYYISEGWGNAKFGSQDESNNLAEDLERVPTCMREDF